MREGHSTNHRSFEKKKRHARNWFVALFLISFCCMSIFSINLLINKFPLSTDTNQQNIPLSPDVVINTGNNAAIPGDTQEKGFEPTPADDTAWQLILVNKWNAIPENYEVELTELINGQSVDTRIYPALQDMFDAARSDGVYPVVVSGYRISAIQQKLLDEKVAEYRALGYSTAEAKTEAEAWVAAPGTSEHQLGIAVDINADGIYSAGYEVYAWLEENAHKYGFICRYPADKTEITGVIGEAWHYRYVGVEAATEIHNQGICLEEYLNSAS